MGAARGAPAVPEGCAGSAGVPCSRSDPVSFCGSWQEPCGCCTDCFSDEASEVKDGCRSIASNASSAVTASRNWSPTASAIR